MDRLIISEKENDPDMLFICTTKERFLSHIGLRGINSEQKSSDKICFEIVIEKQSKENEETIIKQVSFSF